MSQDLLLLYTLPLWFQIYVQSENDPYIKSLLRRTTKILDNSLLLTNKDKNYALSRLHIGWYNTARDFRLIEYDSNDSNDSNDAVEEYNNCYYYYYNIFTTAKLFLKKNFDN